MRRFLLYLSILGCFVTPAWASGVPADIENTIRKANRDLSIKDIQPTPIPGIYELQVGDRLFYIEKTGHYLIAGGHIFDTQSKQDLTAARIEEINKVDWSHLPLDKAIVSGNPKGKEVAIFTDPDCPYCRKLEKALQGQNELKIYTFLFPLEKLHPKARAHAEAIWCAKDRHAAMQTIMLQGKEVESPTCETPIDDIQNLGRELGIYGTPTLIARDGRKRSGAASLEQLLAWLDRK